LFHKEQKSAVRCLQSHPGTAGGAVRCQ